MSMAIYVKFEKYWGEVNVLMTATWILDPRLKMVSIKFVYGRLYSSGEIESRIKKVMDKLWALYDMYAKKYYSSWETTDNTLAFIEITSILFH
jgi:Domain of unknown function (DUF4413)